MPASRRSRHRSKPDPIALSVGETVRTLRKAKHFTFDAFVEETGLGRGYVSELERGLVIPTVKTLSVIAKALEVTMADLVLGESPREQLFRTTADMTAAEVRDLLERTLTGERARSGVKPGDGQ